MLKSEFIDRVTGVPWADRACSFDEMDCWGLVVLYYRHVLGIEIHHAPDYEAGADFLTCFSSEVVYWSLSDVIAEDGIFIAWYGSQPVHVGLIVEGRALHSRGESGHVRADNIGTIQKLFTRVEFYYYADHPDSARSRPAEGKGICGAGTDIQRLA